MDDKNKKPKIEEKKIEFVKKSTCILDSELYVLSKN